MRVKEPGNYGDEQELWVFLPGSIVLMDDGRIGIIRASSRTLKLADVLFLPAREFQDVVTFSDNKKAQLLKSSHDVVRDALSAYAESHAEFVSRDDE